MNNDALDQEKAIIVVPEIALVDAAGAPVKHEVPVIKDGKPVLDDAGDPKTEKQPLVGKDGKPIVKKLAACAPIKDGKTSTARENCRALFVNVSNCMIDFEPPAECKVDDCPAETLEACKKERAAACVKQATAPCVAEKIETWVTDYPDLAKD
jgi:hypothetical protein